MTRKTATIFNKLNLIFVFNVYHIFFVRPVLNIIIQFYIHPEYEIMKHFLLLFMINIS